MHSPETALKTDNSRRLYERAVRLIPGGVNSPARSWRGVGGQPLFFERGSGAHIWDADGNRYIDYVGSWGPLILGHADPRVLKAVQAAAAKGTSFGAPTEYEVRMAELVSTLIPSIEMVRFVNSGTEATMSALRLARAHTGRHMVLKFDGGYHGHEDALLVKAGSGAAAHGIPDSAGVHPGYAASTLTAAYNDLDGVERLLSENAGQVACVIVEPIAGNMGVVLPEPGFLQGLRDLTRRDGALLIFDEVMTGFRVHAGGAQALYGIAPDITCLGKIVGGGFPVGAYGASKDIMRQVAPLGPMYQAGTLSGNPVAMAAGIAMLKALGETGVYERLKRTTDRLADGLRAVFKSAEVPVTVNSVCGMFTVFVTAGPVSDMKTAGRADCQAFSKFFHAMVGNGVYPPPSQFEAWFPSLAHTDADIEATLAAARRALAT